MHPFLQGLTPPLLIAHRGGAKLAPENTLEAFVTAATRHGAPVIEMDLHVTKDGHLVAMHDATLDRTTDGKGAVSSLTLAELKRLDAGARFTPDGGASFPFRGRGVCVPTLSEVLQALPATGINADLKPEDPALAAILARTLRDAEAVTRACVGSKHDHVALALQAALPEGCLFFPRQALSDFVRAAHRQEEPPDSHGFHVMDVPYAVGPTKIVNDALMAAARKRGLWVNVWTVDEPVQMRELLALGVDGIMTDRPDILIALTRAGIDFTP